MTDLPSDLYATLHTNRGDIRLQLFPHHAPKTVRNFVELAEGKREWTDPQSGAKKSTPFYDGLGFHRVIPGFMIQGGCPIGNGTGGPGYTFDDEIHGELRLQQAVPAGDGERRQARWPRHQRLAVLHHRGPARCTCRASTRSSARSPTQAEPRRRRRDRRTPTGAMDRPVQPVVIERVTIEQG